MAVATVPWLVESLWATCVRFEGYRVLRKVKHEHRRRLDADQRRATLWLEKIVNPTELSKLYYFIDAFGGAPQQVKTLVKMALKGASPEGEYGRAVRYVERLAQQAQGEEGGASGDMRTFYSRLEKAAAEATPDGTGEALAQEGVLRAIR